MLTMMRQRTPVTPGRRDACTPGRKCHARTAHEDQSLVIALDHGDLCQDPCYVLYDNGRVILTLDHCPFCGGRLAEAEG